MPKGRRSKNQATPIGAQTRDDIPRCGLCGKTENLTRTENLKGATLSDTTALKEYGVSRDFIIAGIRAGKLHV